MSYAVLLRDFGSRTASSSWGTPVTGPVWTAAGGSGTDYNIVNGVAAISLTSVNVFRSMTSAIATSDVDLRVDVTIGNGVPVGAAVEALTRLRNVDGSNFVECKLVANTNNTVTMAMRQVVTGVATGAATIPVVSGVNANSPVSLRFAAFGTALLGKAWPAGAPEPALWTLSMTTTFTTAAGVLLGAIADTGYTNTLPTPVQWQNVVAGTGVTPLGFVYPTDADLLCGAGLPLATAVEQLADSVQAFLTANDLDALAAASAQGVPSSQVYKQDLVLTPANNPWNGPVDTVVFDKNTPTDYTVYQNGVILGTGVWWVLAEGIAAQNALVTTGEIGSDGNSRIAYPITLSANGANPEPLGGGSQDLKLFRTVSNRAISATVQATGNVAGSNPLITVTALTSIQVSENVS